MSENIRAKSTNARTQNQSSKTKPAVGPLMVSKTNPRYFTRASGNKADREAIYLTGSHIWNNFQDGMGPGADCAETPEPFDYDAYLRFLKEHGQNFIRLWRWEQFKSQAAGGNYHLCMAPQPWPRTGPGTAKDGKPKFDLDSFDPAYFDRLRKRIIAAGDQGIYVAVMLFDGWALHLSSARQRRRSSVPRRQQHQWNRDRVDCRLSSASARPASAEGPGGLYPTGH